VERVTAEGVVIYAQWDDDLAIGGKITIKVNLNYDRKMADPVTNITKGTRMGDVLDYVSVPTRWNHKFVGWYWDRHCTDPVEAGDKVYRNDEIFAKWEKRKTNNEIMLKIYVNGDTKSVAKIVDMYDYAKDGEISMSEVKEAVKKYYSAKNSDGLSFIGLFEADDWSDFVRNHKHNRGSNHINVNRHGDTTIYVMVLNAKHGASNSSATPDSSNPKTGDMIMTPAIVLGASASCLAVLFYLNKKRAY
jgi:LPXTG-motif cell wall-anchored protein